MEGRLACLLLTVLGSAQEPAFGSVDAVPAPAESIQLGTDLRLELIGGDVLVVRGAERLTVARTAPTGCVHAITRDENGTVFAGAENGLFVLDDRHLLLDPAGVRDGVPPGAIRGVALVGAIVSEVMPAWLLLATAAWLLFTFVRHVVRARADTGVSGDLIVAGMRPAPRRRLRAE